MLRRTIALCTLIAFLLPGAVAADELTQIIQQDLQTLGYDTGGTNGEAGTKTIIAISRFQAENDLEVTGEPSPQLAGVIKAVLRNGSLPAQQAAAPARDPAELQAAQQACLQEKVAAAQASNKKKRGLGSLMRAVGRTANRFGGGDTAQQISQTSRDVYDANATAADLESAAKDLGLTESDMEACRNP